MPAGPNEPNARITVNAGSHIRLMGHGDKSIGHGGLGSTTAILNLPSSYYTLMNDENVAFGDIKYNSDGSAAVNPELGTDAVFGIKKQLDKALQTKDAGGTFLIGSETNATSQDKMTITAAAGGTNAKKYGFEGNGHTVYTGTCIPATGTANLGNYGENDFTVEKKMHLPTAMAAGKLQIYNTKGSINFKNKIPATGAAGHVLLMAAQTLTMDENPIQMDINGGGTTTLMGGRVVLKKDETINVNNAGNYNVIAFIGVDDQTGGDNQNHSGQAPSVGQFSWNICGTPSGYGWCGSPSNVETIPTAPPAISSTPLVATAGQGYEGDCKPTFLNTNSVSGHISFSATNSTVTVKGTTGFARWQAYGSIIIPTGTARTLNWTVTNNPSSSDATASWLAGGEINVGKEHTVNWKTATNHAGRSIYWDAGSNIVLHDQVTANWETTGKGDMYWRAGGKIDIIKPTAINWHSSTASEGNMRWEAGSDIKVENEGTALTFKQESKKGNTSWNAVKGNIIVTAGAGGVTFTNSSTEANGEGTMTWIAGKHPDDNNGNTGNIITRAAGQLIKFEQITSPTAGKNAWKAGNDIRTNSKIEFHNATSKYNMEWHACHDILTHHGATDQDNNNDFLVTFKNEKEGNVIWHAGNDIDTRSKTEFESTGTAQGHITWYAGRDIHTRLGEAMPSMLGKGVNFKQEGEGRTIWQAGQDITTHNAVHFQFTGSAKAWASLALLAGRNITLGGVNNSEYEDTHPSARNEFKVETEVNDTVILHANTGYLLTNSLVNIERKKDDPALTKLWAGCGTYTPNSMYPSLRNDIDIEHTFNYTETTGQKAGAWVYLYAENSILSNQACDNRQAPITFTVPAASQTITTWEAERNINTRGRVDFKYGPADKMGPITWLARGGYIQTERPVTIAYKSDSVISFLAEDWRHDRTRNNNIGDVKSNRRGNIHFYDSVDINRNNANGGLTQIKAENHIWTAMVNYVDQQSTGDTMNIISHKGDIYLGYNDGTPTQHVAHDQYVGQIINGNIMQQSVAPSCAPAASTVNYDANRFTYSIPGSNQKGHLWIKAGWEELTDRNAVPDYTGSGPHDEDSLRAAGGNIYFTHINVNQDKASYHPTEISIPFSGLWRCGNSTTKDSSLYNRAGGSRQRYENAGIISGVNRCFDPYPSGNNSTAHDVGLIYRGGLGDLTVDAGNRGNIIFNKGAYLNFQDLNAKTGDAIFRTRFGDIDMRNPFNVDTMRGSLAFLAQIDNLGDLSKLQGEKAYCSCEEERNNVYLQDFEYKAHGASGSVFIGADNNIKLNYGGLQNIGTRHDPFLSQDYEVCPDGKLKKDGRGYEAGGGCGPSLHCDADSNENKARTFLMKFDKDSAGNAITSGGFGAVASDYIDVYKTFAYYGGSGLGMGTVPSTGTLHGENVSGYGLFMKTQANKGNWDTNVFEQTPTCPTPCDGTSCSHDYLHMVSRMTFHNNAYIEVHKQKAMLWSPVIETYGLMTLDTKTDAGSNTEITLKADSLIFHDDFVKIGNRVKLSTWSGLHKDLPIMKFGHMRETPPFRELAYDKCDKEKECIPCHRYIRYSKDPLHMLDTITIKFGEATYLERLNTVVFDHTVLTCLTDSFDHVKGGEVQNAQIFTDTFKIRNQVDLFADKNHERDAHLELISEEQMGSKDYAGIYTKHLHMEPIGACGTPYSELWTSDDLALDVITTSIFGGFGFIHSDVHVENGAHLNAGFTSLRLKGQCYEHKCGTQRMKDLRLDVGAQLHFSVGTTKGLNNEYSDAIEVDRLTTYGSVDVNIEVRPCERMQKRCYPIIYYKSVTPNSLNNLKINPSRVTIDGDEYPLNLHVSTDGVVYVCVGDEVPPPMSHTVTIPSVAGVTTDPGAGFWPTPARGNFKFKATYSGSKPLAVRTNRMINGVPEMLTGSKNANGEYEYIIPHVMQDITLTIGPDYVSNQLLAGTAVWSHGEMIYIRVERADIASIYSVAGQLVRRIELPEGDTSIPMSRGAYVITLKDGSVHKVIVK